MARSSASNKIVSPVPAFERAAFSLRCRMKKSKVNKAIAALKGLRNTPADESISLEEAKESKKENSKKNKGERREEPNRIPSSDVSRLKDIVKKQKASLESRLKEFGVDLSSLSGAVDEDNEESEDRENVESKPEKGSKKTGKASRVGGKAKKVGLLTQPRAQGDSISDATVDLDDIFSEMPESSKEQQQGIVSYLTKLQYIALARAEKMLASPNLLCTPDALIKLTNSLMDMKLTLKWTKKLEDTILNNPSKMKPSGVGGQFRLLDRLAAVAKTVKQEAENDGRKSGIKRGAEINSDLELPAEEKHVGGA
jgi:hypothetical protein